MGAEEPTSVSPDGRRLSPEKVRDLDEVRKATEELTPVDIGRLLAAAKTFLGGFRIDPQQREPWDLFSTAIVRTLAGQRQWHRRVGFQHHLFQTMRSIANLWRREVGRELDVVLRDDGLESLDDHLETPDLRPNPERMMIIRQTLEAIYRHFEDDAQAKRVLVCLARGLTGSSIRYVTGMTQRQLTTTLKRIRHHARREYDDVRRST